VPGALIAVLKIRGKYVVLTTMWRFTASRGTGFQMGVITNQQFAMNT